MAPTVKKTWAPRGQTPVIKHRTRSHRKVTAIAALAVTTRGDTKLQVGFRKGKEMNAAHIVTFLKQLLKAIRGKIIIIWDGLAAHRSKKVAQYLKQSKRVSLEFLPPYAPELNPVEYLWAWMKTNPLANRPLSELTQMYIAARYTCACVKKRRQLLKSFCSKAFSFY